MTQKPLIEEFIHQAAPKVSSDPLYPPTENIKDKCPKRDVCPGFIKINIHSKAILFYCHEMMCKERFPNMLPCPCPDSNRCKGSYWDEETMICKLQEITRCQQSPIAENSY